jgi:hypothetical protein
VHIIERKLKLNFKSCHINKISIRCQIYKMMFCVSFKSSNLNRMHIIMLSQKVDGSMVKGLVSIFGLVEKSIWFTNDMGCG